MFENLEALRVYLVNDFKLYGFKIRVLARLHMSNAVFILIMHTYWLFGLPKNWDPSLKGQGPYDGKQFRIFCFFVYNVSLFINCGHFFNGLLLYNCVQQGIKEKIATLETTKHWIIITIVLIIINVLKFVMLFLHLQYSWGFSLIMTVPEIIFHFVGIFMIHRFRHELRHMPRIEDKEVEEGIYTFAKNGKVIFQM